VITLLEDANLSQGGDWELKRLDKATEIQKSYAKFQKLKRNAREGSKKKISLLSGIISFKI